MGNYKACAETLRSAVKDVSEFREKHSLEKLRLVLILLSEILPGTVYKGRCPENSSSFCSLLSLIVFSL